MLRTFWQHLDCSHSLFEVSSGGLQYQVELLEISARLLETHELERKSASDMQCQLHVDRCLVVS